MVLLSLSVTPRPRIVVLDVFPLRPLSSVIRCVRFLVLELNMKSPRWPALPRFLGLRAASVPVLLSDVILMNVLFPQRPISVVRTLVSDGVLPRAERRSGTLMTTFRVQWLMVGAKTGWASRLLRPRTLGMRPRSSERLQTKHGVWARLVVSLLLNRVTTVPLLLAQFEMVPHEIGSLVGRTLVSISGCARVTVLAGQ